MEGIFTTIPSVGRLPPIRVPSKLALNAPGKKNAQVDWAACARVSPAPESRIFLPYILTKFLLFALKCSNAIKTCKKLVLPLPVSSLQVLEGQLYSRLNEPNSRSLSAQQMHSTPLIFLVDLHWTHSAQLPQHSWVKLSRPHTPWHIQLNRPTSYFAPSSPEMS